MSEPATGGVLATLGLNPKLLAAQLINFGVVLFVLWRWVYKPLLALLDRRTQTVAKGLEQAERAKTQLAEADAQKSHMVRAAHTEAQDILRQARERAEHERQAIVQQTKTDLERQLQEARERLKQEKEVMLATVKNEVAQLVVQATEKAVGENRTNASGKLLKKAIAEVDVASV